MKNSLQKFNITLLFLFGMISYGQNGIIGAGFTNGWSTVDIISFGSGVGSSRIVTLNPRNTGNQFFRLVRNWSGDLNQFGPFNCLDTDWTNPGVIYGMSVCNTSGAFFIDCPNTTDNYVFKTRNGDTANDLLYFRVQGAVRTIISASNSTSIANQNVTVTANLDGNLNSGQDIYLRYTSNNYATSTVVKLTGTGSTFSAIIPASVNNVGANISYFLFTSGSNGVASDGSNMDFYAINLNNNGGSNYNYTVPAPITASPSVSICNGDSTILTVSSTNSNYTYTWSPSMGLNSTSGSTVTANPLNSTTYTVTAVDGTMTTSATIVVSVGGTSIWSGTPPIWTPSAPTSIDAAIISENYSESADITACTLTVNNGAVVSIPSGMNINLQGAITISSGSMTMSNNASLIQTKDVNNTGNISITRETASLMRQDYVLWSAPVTDQQLQAFSPGTLSNRFYTYNPSTDLYVSVSSPSTTNFNEGTGYLIRVPNNHPTSPTVLSRTFTGVPNNGDVSIAVANDTFNAIGNPYPSRIDADTFIADNAITEALYFWRKTNSSGTSTSYASYTTAGGVANTGFDPLGLVPNGIIQVGQGFIAKSTSTSLNFTNSMRVQDTSGQFFRINQNRSRVWLNLTNNQDYFCQTMVAYMPNATLGIDAAIDGRLLNDSATGTTLSSIINNQEFAIQGRPIFDVSDVVALGFKSESAGNFTIAINNVDGLFADGQQVYLKDNTLNTIHNLSTSAYNFATEAGVFNTRFEIVYENNLATLNPVFSENNVIIYKKDLDVIINSGVVDMKSVQVYDVQGRLLVEKTNINATNVKVPVSATNQVLIVKVTAKDNTVVTKKVII